MSNRRLTTMFLGWLLFCVCAVAQNALSSEWTENAVRELITADIDMMDQKTVDDYQKVIAAGAAAFPALVKMLEHESTPLLRSRVISVFIASTGDKELPRKAICGLLANETEKMVLIMATKALAAFGAAEDERSLLPLLQNPDYSVCDVAIEALGRIGDANALLEIQALAVKRARGLPAEKVEKDYTIKVARAAVSRIERRLKGLDKLVLIEAVAGPKLISYETPFRVLEAFIRSRRDADYDLYLTTVIGVARGGTPTADPQNRFYDVERVETAKKLFVAKAKMLQELSEIRIFQKEDAVYANVQFVGKSETGAPLPKITLRFANTPMGWRIDSIDGD